jgi:hypothetical protein
MPLLPMENKRLLSNIVAMMTEIKLVEDDKTHSVHEYDLEKGL